LPGDPAHRERIRAGTPEEAYSLVRKAAEENSRVALIDLNFDQANTTQWWILRGEPDNPALFNDFDDLIGEVKEMRREGWDYIVIDTPPAGMARARRGRCINLGNGSGRSDHNQRSS
jgi:Mrp family chromosome partitioning ATPase